MCDLSEGHVRINDGLRVKRGLAFPFTAEFAAFDTPFFPLSDLGTAAVLRMGHDVRRV